MTLPNWTGGKSGPANKGEANSKQSNKPPREHLESLLPKCGTRKNEPGTDSESLANSIKTEHFRPLRPRTAALRHDIAADLSFKAMRSPERIGWICGSGSDSGKQEVGNVAIAKQGRKKRFAFVIVPGAGCIVGAAGGAIIPGKVSQDNFFFGRARDFRGFNLTEITRLRP